MNASKLDPERLPYQFLNTHTVNLKERKSFLERFTSARAIPSGLACFLKAKWTGDGRESETTLPWEESKQRRKKIHFCLCILSLKKLLTALKPGKLLHLSLIQTFVSSWPDSTAGPDAVWNHFTAASQEEKEADVMGNSNAVWRFFWLNYYQISAVCHHFRDTCSSYMKKISKVKR